MGALVAVDRKTMAQTAPMAARADAVMMAAHAGHPPTAELAATSMAAAVAVIAQAAGQLRWAATVALAAERQQIADLGMAHPARLRAMAVL
jgi:hypothetical protein